MRGLPPTVIEGATSTRLTRAMTSLCAIGSQCLNASPLVGSLPSAQWPGQVSCECREPPRSVAQPRSPRLPRSVAQPRPRSEPYRPRSVAQPRSPEPVGRGPLWLLVGVMPDAAAVVGAAIDVRAARQRAGRSPYWQWLPFSCSRCVSSERTVGCPTSNATCTQTHTLTLCRTAWKKVRLNAKSANERRQGDHCERRVAEQVRNESSRIGA